MEQVLFLEPGGENRIEGLLGFLAVEVIDRLKEGIAEPAKMAPDTVGLTREESAIDSRVPVAFSWKPVLGDVGNKPYPELILRFFCGAKPAKFVPQMKFEIVRVEEVVLDSVEDLAEPDQDVVSGRVILGEVPSLLPLLLNPGEFLGLKVQILL
jgi:hypothetical protein